MFTTHLNMNGKTTIKVGVRLQGKQRCKGRPQSQQNNIVGHFLNSSTFTLTNDLTGFNCSVWTTEFYFFFSLSICVVLSVKRISLKVLFSSCMKERAAFV